MVTFVERERGGLPREGAPGGEERGAGSGENSGHHLWDVLAPLVTQKEGQEDQRRVKELGETP